jgi:hypothetical protein
MWLCRNVIVLFSFWAATAFGQQEQSGAAAAKTCETDGGQTCRSSDARSTKCNVSNELCQASNHYSIYNHGGSAQAYVPNAPIKNNVCESDNKMKHKVATWPLTRGTRKSVPKLTVITNLWSCSDPTEKEQCCCQTLLDKNTKMEVWQARPDGTYSSLMSGNGDCRATIIPENGQANFTTLAPGSVGALGGLGPGGWDVAPYGPPAIHLLVTSPNHESLLIHIPIVPHVKTLEQKSFWGGDWRGHAGRKRHSVDAFNMTTWNVGTNNEIQVEIDIYLTQGNSFQDLVKDLCPSRLYGMPKSFYTEPIAVCAPSLLNFFPL